MEGSPRQTEEILKIRFTITIYNIRFFLGNPGTMDETAAWLPPWTSYFGPRTSFLRVRVWFGSLFSGGFGRAHDPAHRRFDAGSWREPYWCLAAAHAGVTEISLWRRGCTGVSWVGGSTVICGVPRRPLLIPRLIRSQCHEDAYGHCFCRPWGGLISPCVESIASMTDKRDPLSETLGPSSSIRSWHELVSELPSKRRRVRSRSCRCTAMHL